MFIAFSFFKLKQDTAMPMQCRRLGLTET
jgi:hypothetical protein